MNDRADIDPDPTTVTSRRKLVYSIEERPGIWWESLLFGWQHTLVDISPFVLPVAVAVALGMSAPC